MKVATLLNPGDYHQALRFEASAIWPDDAGVRVGLILTCDGLEKPVLGIMEREHVDGLIAELMELRNRTWPTFTIGADGLSIECHLCHAVSRNLGDVMMKYCGRCGTFHEVDRPAPTPPPVEEGGGA